MCTSLALEWMARQVGSATWLADNLGVVDGVPLVGALWCLLRYGASGRDARPNVGDDVIVLVGALLMWLIV